MGPLIPQEVIGEGWNFFIAFAVGIGFGFVLEQAGFSSSRKLAGVFYGYDAVVLKVFFTAAVTGMLGLLYFSLFGWIDLSMVWVNPTYLWSAIIGGIIMGAGFIIGGFCPGTSVCAAAIGKIDAMVFVVGIAVGIFGFGELYPMIKSLYLAEYLGQVKLSTIFGISQGVLAFFVIIAALLMFWIAEIAEKKFPREEY
ncbi:MAG: YeeE/YedE family protein [Candidatus Marinimicrobia bacterium]|nr:YeeE/YedE family protein [Candidatus Neomarinimicrobiota bacterium]MBT3763662.1 YeeE/YedE family protein [Candidatus Neomarinimicrobiota bacterium]MBT4068745.1 YeeE/YedE family protein [Candidatus Neomarinimicrobiota bacterium]MBT4271312.1 YeeE/YedE family protein [Candidatus Neomarinimicrobiota bacterium]MBT4372243.1 YeeE/YedE family protein [Candidatus Neomarinimicrobiota bacterium]